MSSEIHPDDYSAIVLLAVEEAEFRREHDERFTDDKQFDDIKFHDVVFAAVLEACDKDPHLAQYEAADISAICSEVEDDILHGDIRGTRLNLRS